MVYEKKKSGNARESKRVHHLSGSVVIRHSKSKFPIFRPSRRKFSSGRLLSKQSAGESESSSSDSGNNGASSGGVGGSGFDAMEDLSRRTREATVSSPISPLKSSDYNPFRESFGATAAVGPRGHSMAPAVQSSSSLRYQPIASNYRSAGYSSTSGFPAGVREKASEIQHKFHKSGRTVGSFLRFPFLVEVQILPV